MDTISQETEGGAETRAEPGKGAGGEGSPEAEAGIKPGACVEPGARVGAEGGAEPGTSGRTRGGRLKMEGLRASWWRNPASRKVTPVSLVAFALHVLAELLVVVAFTLPRWWRLTFNPDYYTDYGLWVKVVCRSNGCEVAALSPIRPGKEFLFIATVFQCLALGLTSAGFIAHALYLPIRHPVVRSVAIYTLAASGLFLLPSCFTLLGGLKSLGGGEGVEASVGPSLVVSLLGGVVCLVGSALTALATIQKAKRLEDEVVLT